jgi:hypothetical protein
MEVEPQNIKKDALMKVDFLGANRNFGSLCQRTV